MATSSGGGLPALSWMWRMEVSTTYLCYSNTYWWYLSRYQGRNDLFQRHWNQHHQALGDAPKGIWPTLRKVQSALAKRSEGLPMSVPVMANVSLPMPTGTGGGYSVVGSQSQWTSPSSSVSSLPGYDTLASSTNLSTPQQSSPLSLPTRPITQAYSRTLITLLFWTFSSFFFFFPQLFYSFFLFLLSSLFS